VEKIHLLENGDVLELTRDSARKNGKVAVGRVCIDAGSTAGVVEDVVMRDRRPLSEGGIVLPILAINQTTGRVESMPEIVTRGFAAGEEALIEQARQVVGATLEASSAEEKADYGVIKEKIRQDLKRYIQKNTSRRPLIMPVILEI
jgi:ribonuclease J